MRYKSLSSAIRERRKLLSLNQADLAEIAGVGARTVFQLESAQGNPTQEVVNKVTEALGLEIMYQVKGTEDA